MILSIWMLQVAYLSIPKKPLSAGRPVYIYEIVCWNPYEKGKFLPVASMASAVHDTATVTLFLQTIF